MGIANARGVADIHRAGIIHLGIQPEAIALTDNDEVRIGDFHRACAADDAKVHEPFSRAAEKPEYRAPQDEAFSAASDIYSVGMTLLEMATGKVPSISIKSDELLMSIDDPAKRDTISGALRDDPCERPDADELLEMIRFGADTVIRMSDVDSTDFDIEEALAAGARAITGSLSAASCDTE